MQAIEEESAVALARSGEGLDYAVVIVLPAGEGRGGNADEGGGCGIGETLGDALADQFQGFGGAIVGATARMAGGLLGLRGRGFRGGRKRGRDWSVGFGVERQEVRAWIL